MYKNITLKMRGYSCGEFSFNTNEWSYLSIINGFTIFNKPKSAAIPSFKRISPVYKSLM